MAQIKKINTELQILNKFLDTSGDAGTSQKILRSTGTGVDWFSGFSSVYTVGAVGSGASWINMGTFTAGQGGKSIFIKIVSNNGYNATISQNYEVYIRFKTSNGGSTDANGFAADSSFYTTGPNGSMAAGNIKWVADAAGTSATAYTLYVLFAQFTGDGSFYVAENSTGTWVNSGTTATDPGVASSTVLIPQEQFRVGATDFVVNGGGGDAYFANSNVGIGTSSPSEKLTLQLDSQNQAFSGKNGTDYLWFLRNEAGAGARQSGRFQLMDTDVTTVNIESASNRNTYFNAGNVGIGTNSPNTTLEVNGDINFNYAGDRGFICDPGQGTFSLGDINEIGGGAYITTNNTNIDYYAAGVITGRLEDDGTLTVTGDMVAYGSPSDKRLKENIKPIESALDKAMKLQGVTFDWKENNSILDIKEDIGFIAQDVQKVVPELVRENSNGMLSMRHQGITPILLEAIKELKAEIEELKKQIK